MFEIREAIQEFASQRAEELLSQQPHSRQELVNQITSELRAAVETGVDDYINPNLSAKKLEISPWMRYSHKT